MSEKTNKKANVPNLRFPGFEGEWVEKKLREIAEINPSNKSLPEKFIYIDLESVVNGELIKENEIVKSEAPSRAQRILKKNDVLFQMVRPYQMNNLYFHKNGDYIASTGYAQIRTKQNSHFVFQYLHYPKFVDKVIERCTGTSYPAINSTDLSNISISFPSISEQDKIAAFLALIDRRIQTQNKIIEKLETLIKGLRDNLFGKEETPIPALRFPNFNNIWSEVRLGDFTTRVVRRNKDKQTMLALTIAAKYGLVDQRAFFNRQIASQDMSNYYLLLKGEFAYNKSYSNDYPWGAIKRLDLHEKGALSSLYLCFAVKHTVDSDYLVHYFETNKWHKAISDISGEGARNHGLLNMSVHDFFNTYHFLPKNEEQKKIGSFLNNMSKKAATEKDILALYRKQKTVLMNNLFI